MFGKWDLRHFLGISLALHTALALASGLIVALPPIAIPRVIKVTIVADAAPKANEDFQYGKIVELPEPKTPLPAEMPEKADVLSSINARARAHKKGQEVKLAPHRGKQELKAEEYRTEKRKHRQAALMASAAPAVRATDKPNPFSELELANARHEKAGEEAPLAPDKLAKTEREDQKPRPALSGDEIDRFAAANPAGELETDREIVLPFNTRKFDYMEYFSLVRRAVERAWYYPDDAMEKGIGGNAVVRFTLDRGGKLEEAKVITSAGYVALDKAALEAVRRSAPFKPFPENLAKQKIHIVATFRYQPQYGKVP